jgi:lipopolysaccharide biosynthesis regulator YciM
VLLRVLLLIVIILFSLLGYITYLNHEIHVTFLLIPGKPFTAALPAVVVTSFAAGALIIFLAGLIRDVVEGWKGLKKGRKAKKEEALQAEIAKGLSFLFQGNVEQARIHLTNALRRDPDNLDIYAKLSDMHAGRGELKEAVDLLERGWAIDPQNEEILLKKAKLYDQMGNLAMATTTLEKILAMDPKNLPALMALRDVYVQQKNWKEALSVQKSIVSNTKGETHDASREKSLYLGLRYEYAQSLVETGDEGSLEKALTLCKDIIRSQKEFQPAYILLGDIYQKQKRWVEAGKILGRGFRVSRGVIFLLRLEDLYLKRNDRKTLLKIYRRTLENNPDNSIIPLFYSRLCLRLNMLDEAMDELVEMKNRRKDMAALHGLMAEIFAQKGQFEPAAQEYKSACELADSLRLPFVCQSCHRESTEWIARCPSCHQWNTHVLVGEENPSADR